MRLNVIEKINNKLNEMDVDEIYDCMSTDDHTLVATIDGVQLQAVYNYGYVDIIGLTANEFTVLQMLLNERGE